MKNNIPKETLAGKIMNDLFVEKTPVEPEARLVPRRKVKEPQKERLQLTIQPSMKAALQQYADEHDKSMNKLLLEILGDFLKRENYL
jgi:hypothetical protein